MTRLLTITDIAPPLSPPLERYVHSLFCDISIFDWLQTTAAIPTPTLPCQFALTPLPLVQIVNLTLTVQWKRLIKMSMEPHFISRIIVHKK